MTDAPFEGNPKQTIDHQTKQPAEPPAPEDRRDDAAESEPQASAARFSGDPQGSAFASHPHPGAPRASDPEAPRPQQPPTAPESAAPEQAAPEQSVEQPAPTQPAPEQPATEHSAPAPKAIAPDPVDREVADAMAAMSERDLAELTLGKPAPAQDEEPTGPDPGIQLGRIEAIHDEEVFISLGQKAQGVLPRNLVSPSETLAVGEPIEVVVDRYDRESDLLILTRKGHARSAAWDLLKPGDVVEGRVIGLNRGGLEVQLKGIKAFLPASHVDVMHVKDISIFLNEHVRCEVLEIDRRGKSLTISRRKVIEKERAAQREQLLAEIEVGQVRKGVVGNLTEFGAFVDIGGVDGLIHISDLSHKQLKDPSEVVKTGDVVEVKVLKVQDSKGKKRISLGLKQTQPDPWDDVENRFDVGSTHRARVVRLADFGAFAELSEGIEGLIPVSEMAWSRVNRPKEVVEVGQLVDVSVIRVEPKRKRIALSMKQAQPDPWAEVMESYTPNATVDGTVTRLADFGVFIELAPGIEGMAHISELSDKRVKACSDVVKAGQEVKARVLKVDRESRRISLSLKPAPAEREAAAAAAIDLGKAKPKKKDRKLRGGLSSDWDWTGVGLDNLSSGDAHSAG